MDADPLWPPETQERNLQWAASQDHGESLDYLQRPLGSQLTSLHRRKLSPSSLFVWVQAFAAQARYWRSAGPTHSLTGRNHLHGGGGRRKGYGPSLGGLRPSPAPGPLTPQPLSRKMPVDYSSPRWHTGHLRRLWEPREVPRGGWGGGGERVKGDCCHSIRPLDRQLSSNPRDPLRGRS